jgi:putative heme-binding domain-containing protein
VTIARASLCLVAAALLGPAQTVNPFADSASDIDVGRGTFRIYCSPCHGITAQGGRGPDLTLGVYQAGDSDADLFRVISEGVDGSEMPAYGDRMNENSIWRIVSYVRSAAKPDQTKPTGDAAAGKAVYHSKGGCAGCHQIGLEGGRLGPELTRIGRSRSLAHLRRALLEPDAELTPDYGTVEIETTDGKVIRGVEKNFDNFYVTIMEPGEKLHSYERDKLKRSERSTRSMMPAYGKSLSDKEIDDLVAYLANLRGEEGKR